MSWVPAESVFCLEFFFQISETRHFIYKIGETKIADSAWRAGMQITVMWMDDVFQTSLVLRDDGFGTC